MYLAVVWLRDWRRLDSMIQYQKNEQLDEWLQRIF